jgi:hypothetical protein
MASAARWTNTGGNGPRTVLKWARAITARRSGFGMPLRLVLPSDASVNIVSISDSNASAGRTSQRKRASPFPAFSKRCGVPGLTVATPPGPTTSFSSPTRSAIRPSSTSKRSVWNGCTWAAATKPSGCKIVSNSTDSPSVSSAVRWKMSTSPVTGFSSLCPLRIIVVLFVVPGQRFCVCTGSTASAALSSPRNRIRGRPRGRSPGPPTEGAPPRGRGSC